MGIMRPKLPAFKLPLFSCPFSLLQDVRKVKSIGPRTEVQGSWIRIPQKELTQPDVATIVKIIKSYLLLQDSRFSNTST